MVVKELSKDMAFVKIKVELSLSEARFCEEVPIRISFYTWQSSPNRGILSRIGLTLVEHEDFAAEYMRPRLEFGGLYVSGESYLIVQLKNNDPYNINIKDNESLAELLGASRSAVHISPGSPLLVVKYVEVRFSYRELNYITNVLFDLLEKMGEHNITFLGAGVIDNRVSVGVDIGADMDAALDTIVKYLMNYHGVYEESYYRDIILIEEFGRMQIGLTW